MKEIKFAKNCLPYYVMDVITLVKLAKRVDITPQQSKIFGIHDDIYIIKVSETNL